MKAVLVIDMPEHCYECPLVNYKHCNANYFVRRNHGGNIPYNFSNEYIHEQGRQTWCPLRPLPQRYDEDLMREQKGWNRCLDEILWGLSRGIDWEQDDGTTEKFL